MLGFLIPYFRLRTLFVLLGLAAIGAVIWYFGPLAVYGGHAPLAPAQHRLFAILAIVALVVGVALFRYWRARRANAKLISKLMDNDGLMSLTETQSQEEVTILRERFQDALKILKETRLKTAEGSGFLLDLPWYIIIGPPGSGKTTILRNSGLDFPLAERVGADVLAGVGGTRNCDWWFTDQAVLLDTAGRYTTQDSNAAIDRAAWRGFLDLLREFRRRRPLNGVLLAISLGDILSRNEAERAEHVDVFRRRLQELMRAFGMRLPVYLLITKSDLVAGFTEFFDDLSDRDRLQPWGMSFTPSQADTALASAYDNGFAELLARVLDRLQPRLHAERDPQRRRQIYAFPQQFAGVRELVGGFVNDVFRPNRYELAPMLRGVFFTSGTQEGTPIDRLMGAFSRAFGLPAAQVPTPIGKGRTFFVNQMMNEMVFAESGLAGTNSKLERRLAVTHGLGYAAAAALVVGLGLLWFTAYSSSSADAGSLAVVAAQLRTLRGASPPPTIVASLPVLDQARTVAHFYDNKGFLENWVERLGLASAASLAPGADAVYQRVLSSDLLPLMARRIQDQLVAALQSNAPNPVLHDLLALYLMLGEPEHFDRAAVSAWMQRDATAAFPLEPARRAALAAHYQGLLDRLPVSMPIDRELVNAARIRLVSVPPAQAIYNSLRSKADGNAALPAFTFASVVGQAADTAFANPAATGMRAVIPGFYTRAGFYDTFTRSLPVIVRDQVQSDWVLGQDNSAPSVAAARDLMRRVADLYVRDYIAAWQAATLHIGLTRWSSFDGLQAVLQTLIGPEQPLTRMVEAIRANTDLPQARDADPGTPGAKANPPGPSPAAAPGPSPVDAALNSAAETVGLSVPPPWPGDQIRQAFQSLIALSQAQPGQAAPIGRITDEIGGVYAVITQLAANADPTAAALRYVSAQQRNQATDTAGTLRIDAATRPEPLRSMMLQVANSVTGTIVGGARQQVSSIWRSQVLPGCQMVVGNRYPFVGKARDEVPLSDFSDFFRPGGTVDQFAKSLASMPGATPGLALAATGAAPLPASLQQQIAAAARVRSAFFGSGSDLMVKFSLTATGLDPTLARVMLQVDNQSLVYRHDPPRAIDFQWPTAVDASIARITLNDFKTDTVVAEEKGPWALFRLMDDVGLTPLARPDSFGFTIDHNGMKASFILTASSDVNAFQMSALRRFRCFDGN